MKRIHHISTLIIIVFSLVAKIALSQTDMEMKTRIEQINASYADAILNGSTDKFIALFTSDAIELPSYEPMREGVAAIRKANEDNIKKGWKVSDFNVDLYKTIPSGNLITEIGTYKITWTMKGMQKPMDDHGKYVTILEKQKDGSLKIKVQTWNSDMDPMASMQSMDSKK